jgi:hypothetical protein
MKIHSTYTKKDLVNIINEYKIDIDTSLTRFNIVKLFHNNDYITQYNLHFLCDENPNKVLSIKEKNNIVLKAKQINSLQKNGFNLSKSLFTSHYDVISTALFLSNYGDISSVRRAVKFVNEFYDKNIVCKISQRVRQNLMIKEEIKSNSVPCLQFNKGTFLVTFD